MLARTRFLHLDSASIHVFLHAVEPRHFQYGWPTISILSEIELICVWQRPRHCSISSWRRGSGASLANLESQFLDAVAVAMITTGPVVITVAFIGLPCFWESLARALRRWVFSCRSIFSSSPWAPFYKRFSGNPQVRAFVQGVTAAATGAITGAVVVLGRHSIQDFWTLGIAVTTFLVLLKWKVPRASHQLTVAGLLGIIIRLGP